MRKAPDPFTFADVFRVIRKNLLISLLLAGAGGAGAYVVAQGIPDRYAATAQLISDASRSGLITTNNEGPDETGDATATSTMVETIGTSAVLNHALTEMSPEGFALLAQSAKIDPIPTNLAGMDDETRQALLRALSQSLTVNNSGRSFVINLSYLSESPLLSADAANAVAEGYLRYRLELRNAVYAKMLANLQQQIADLTNGLKNAEQTAQTMREKVRLLAQRNDVWVEGRQDQAIAENAQLYASQREAEREVAATAVVYERLLLEHRQIQSRMGEPEIAVQLFSPATVPTRPSGFNVKPILLMLGIVAGLLAGLSIGLIRERIQRHRKARKEGTLA